MDTFTDWLEQQMLRRGWTVSELARRADLKPASLSRILNGTRDAGLDACIGIAKALGISVDAVVRKAYPHKLPPLTEDQTDAKELLHYFYPLPAGDRKRVITIVKALREARTKYSIEENCDAEEEETNCEKHLR